MRIALFATCLVDSLFPDVGKATVALLERLGHQVEFPEAADLLRPDARQHRLPAPRHCRWYAATSRPSSRTRRSWRPPGRASARYATSTRWWPASTATRNSRYGPRRSRRRPTSSASCSSTCWVVEDVGATYPHRVTYHPTCHSLRMIRVGDKPLRLLRQVQGHRPGRAAGRRRLLRLRRHLRGQELRRVHGDAGRQDDQRPLDRRRDLHGRRQLVPHAHRRRPLPAEHRGPHRASRRGPGLHGPVMSTFLGLPTAPHSGNLRGEGLFPAAAAEAVTDTQLRRNIGHATATIRAKRARVVGEVPDWQELREAGRGDQGRDDGAPRPLPACSSRRRSPLAGASSTGLATPTRPTASSPSWSRRPARRRGGQGQVDGHAGDRAQRGARGRGHHRVRDRPGRAHRPARPRPARRTSWCRPSTRTVRRSRTSSGARCPTYQAISPTSRRGWPTRPGCTCGVRSSRPRSRSAAPTSGWPRPAR